VVVEHNGVHLYPRTCCCNRFIGLYEQYEMGKAPTNHGPLRRNFLYFIAFYYMVCLTTLSVVCDIQHSTATGDFLYVVILPLRQRLGPQTLFF